MFCAGCLEAEPVLLLCCVVYVHFGSPRSTSCVSTSFCFSLTAQGHYERREGSSLVTVQGYIFQAEQPMEPENAVGFFSLVMATDDLPSEDFDVTKSSAD